MTYGALLRRSRHGTLYFRFVIPHDLRALVGQSELSISLGTASKRAAELVVLKLRLAAKSFTPLAQGRYVRAFPAKTRLWALLYARVQQADGRAWRNVLI